MQELIEYRASLYQKLIHLLNMNLWDGFDKRFGQILFIWDELNNIHYLMTKQD